MYPFSSLTRFVPHVVTFLGGHRSLAYRNLIAIAAVRCVAVRMYLGLVSIPSTDAEILTLLFQVASELDESALATVAESESRPDTVDYVERTAILRKQCPRTAEFISSKQKRLLTLIAQQLGRASASDALAEDVFLRVEYKFLMYADSQLRQGNPRVEQNPEAWAPFLFGRCLNAALLDEHRASRKSDFLLPFAPLQAEDGQLESWEAWVARHQQSEVAQYARTADLKIFSPDSEQEDDMEAMVSDDDLRQEAARIAQLLQFFELAGKHRWLAHAVWEQLLKYRECLSWEHFMGRMEQYLSNARRNAWCDEVTRNAGLGTSAKSQAARNKAVSRIREALRKAWEAAKQCSPLGNLPGWAC